MGSPEPSWVIPAKPPNLAASLIFGLALFVGGLVAAYHGWKTYQSEGELAPLLTFLVPIVGFLGLLHSLQILRMQDRRAGVEFRVQSPPAPGHAFRATLLFPESFPLGNSLRVRIVCLKKGAHRSVEWAELHPRMVVWQDMGAFTIQRDTSLWRQVHIAFQVPHGLPAEVFAPGSATWFLSARPDVSLADQDLFYPIEPGEPVPAPALSGPPKVSGPQLGPSPYRESRSPDGQVILIHRPWRVRMGSLSMLLLTAAFGGVTWLLWNAMFFPFGLLTGTAALVFAAFFPALLFEGCRIQIRGGILVSSRYGRVRRIGIVELADLEITGSNGATVGTRQDVLARYKDGRTWVLTGRLQDAVEAKAAIGHLRAALGMPTDQPSAAPKKPRVPAGARPGRHWPNAILGIYLLCGLGLSAFSPSGILTVTDLGSLETRSLVCGLCLVAATGIGLRAWWVEYRLRRLSATSRS